MGRKSTPVLLIRECIWALLDSPCLRAILSEPRWLDLLQTTLRVLWSQCWPCATVCTNDCSLAVHAAGAASHMLPAEVVAPPSLALVDILEHVICYGIHGHLVVRMRMCLARTLEATYSTLFSPNQENPFRKEQKLITRWRDDVYLSLKKTKTFNFLKVIYFHQIAPIAAAQKEGRALMPYVAVFNLSG